MNILVTGGAGYVGSAVVERLDSDARVSAVLVVDNLSGSRTQFLFGGGRSGNGSASSSRLTKTRVREANILDAHERASLLKGMDVVAHAAGVTRHTQFYYEDVVYEQVNRWGTASLCNLLRGPGSTVRRVVYLSTTSVYGKDAVVEEGADSGSESSVAAPSDPYAISKFEGERYVAALGGARGAAAGEPGAVEPGAVEPVILRLGQVFGYNACVRTDTVVNSLIVSALQSGQVHIYGQGGQRKLFVALPFVVERIVEAALGAGDVPAAPLNLFQYELSVREVVDVVERALGRPLDRIHVSRDLNYGSLVSNLAGGPDKAEADLVAAVRGFQDAYRL